MKQFVGVLIYLLVQSVKSLLKQLLPFLPMTSPRSERQSA